MAGAGLATVCSDCNSSQGRGSLPLCAAGREVWRVQAEEWADVAGVRGLARDCVIPAGAGAGGQHASSASDAWL